MSASPRDPGPVHATVAPQAPVTPPPPRMRGRLRRNSALIASISTFAVLGVIVLVFVTAPGARKFQEAFLSPDAALESAHPVWTGFVINIELMLAAEALVLVFALVIAVVRGLPGPAAFPLRMLAIAYTDFFRGVPTILVIYILGFGAPALQLGGVPSSPLFWGITALVLVYSAYVAEVYRAGIESVHPSQVAAARSLGLTRWQSLRFVVLPQAVRRVVPPLLNDFIGLQKDTALLALIGVLETFRQSQVDVAGAFNYTPYLATALLFVLITIPLARLTDWLIARERRRRR